MKIRALFSGACNGDWKNVFTRVAKINDKKGPFDVLFCFGNFFTASGPEDDSSQGRDLECYLEAHGPAPLDTYIIGGFGRASNSGIAAISKGDSNVTYLGKSGVTRVKGLSVAFLDGVYEEERFRETESHSRRYYTEEDVLNLKNRIKGWEGDIDILLTCEWPTGILNGIAKSAIDALPEISGSRAVSDVAALTRPRYHFVSDAPVYYSRAPYENPDLGAGSHVTRFISLAASGIPNQKSLIALQLVPADEMDPEDRHGLPDDSTRYPYQKTTAKANKRNFEEEDGAQPWRWHQNKRHKGVQPSLGNPGVVKDRRKTCFVNLLPLDMDESDVLQHFSTVGQVTSIYRGTNADGVINSWAFIQYASKDSMREACRRLNNSDPGRGRNIRVEPAAAHDRDQDRNPYEPVDGCWFCLGSSASDKSLVASVGSECYIALDKGPISDDHVLIIPTSHQWSTLDMPHGWAQISKRIPALRIYLEVRRYLSALKSLFASSGRSLVAFERFIRLRRSGGNHSILSIISIPSEKENEAKETFTRMCQAHGLDLTCLEKGDGSMCRESVRDLVGDEEYFMAIMPDGTRLIRPITKLDRLPITFGREVFAELVGKPDRINWKICVGSKEEEQARVERFRNVFAPFDIMNKDDDDDE